MGPLAVVALEPGIREITHLADGFKRVRIKDLGAIAAIEAFDVGILIGFARLNVVQRHPVRLAPVDERLRDKFWPVVGAQRTRTPVQCDEILEDPDDAWARDGRRDFDRQPFPVPLVEDRQRAKSLAAVQRVGQGR